MLPGRRSDEVILLGRGSDEDDLSGGGSNEVRWRWYWVGNGLVGGLENGLTDGLQVFLFFKLLTMAGILKSPPREIG